MNCMDHKMEESPKKFCAEKFQKKKTTYCISFPSMKFYKRWKVCKRIFINSCSVAGQGEGISTFVSWCEDLISQWKSMMTSFVRSLEVVELELVNVIVSKLYLNEANFNSSISSSSNGEAWTCQECRLQ